MIKEINFNEYADFIRAFREASYGDELHEYTDRFDKVAHHFFVYDLEGQVAGMFRIIRNDESNCFEINEDATQIEIDGRRLTIEISRFCIRPAIMRSKTLAFELFDHIVTYCRENRIEYAVSWVREELLSMYQKFGFQRQGGAFKPHRFSSVHFPLVLGWQTYHMPAFFKRIRNKYLASSGKRFSTPHFSERSKDVAVK